MSDSLLSCHVEDGVATVTFEDPERLNAMTEAMGHALAERMGALATDEAVRVVVLTGAGRAFSAGGDLAMLTRMSEAGQADAGGPTRDRHHEFMRGFYGLYLSVRDLPQPSIAAINGPAVGAGCCVALACDLRVVSKKARMGLNFTRLGIHPGMGATWTLPRLIGSAQAAELLYTGRLVSGEEALSIGLVNRAVEPEDVLSSAQELAREIATTSPIALRQTKQSLARTEGSSLSQQLDREAAAQALCYETRDLGEGLAAVQEKREPRFEGR
ncbi:MAG: enoyl-CoA hydratase [Myxococcota bacterium]|nr:enoyl-CoA hydratase [Myxococcota bacterium]